MPVNPFLPYGNTRNSKTSSRAIAAMPPQGSMPQFNGIGSLPSPEPQPKPTTQLFGGLGKVRANGRDLGDLIQNQTGPGGTHGLEEMPQVTTQDLVNMHVRGGRSLNKEIDHALRAFNPESMPGNVWGNDPMVAQSFINSPGAAPGKIEDIARATKAQRLLAAGVDPTSPEYTAMLLGHAPAGASPSATPQPMPQQMPPNLPAPQPNTNPGFQQRIPQMADPLADPDRDGDGFRMRRPEYDNSIPGFAPVANGGTMPGGPMDEHGYNPGFDPYQQYNMPQYNQGNDPFYKGVNDVAMGGLDNKQYMDKVRREDWERDRRNRGWDEFAGGFLTPLQSMFVKDNGARQNMLAGGQAQATRYQQSRQLRDAERRDQFGEDKYYTDLRQANDPNSYENWLAGQNARTSRLNAQTGVNNSRTNEAYRQQMAQNGAERNDINQAFNQWRMQHGDSMESRRAFESAWKMSQGQQRIDNQASQFQTNAGFRDQEIGLKSKMLEMQGQRLQAQMEQAQKAGDLNQQRLLLQQMQALANLYVIDPKTGEPKFANEAFELFGAQPPQKPEAPEPEPGFLKQILNGFKLSEPAQSEPKAEPTVKTSKLNKGTLSKIGRSSKSATTTKYDQNNAKHQALIAEAFARYPNDKEAARKYFLKRVGK